MPSKTFRQFILFWLLIWSPAHCLLKECEQLGEHGDQAGDQAGDQHTIRHPVFAATSI